MAAQQQQHGKFAATIGRFMARAKTHFIAEEPWVLQWIRTPSDACGQAKSIWICCVWAEKFFNTERKSRGFKNIRIVMICNCKQLRESSCPCDLNVCFAAIYIRGEKRNRPARFLTVHQSPSLKKWRHFRRSSIKTKKVTNFVCFLNISGKKQHFDFTNERLVYRFHGESFFFGQN